MADKKSPTTRTDIDQVARMAEALGAAAYRWDGTKFVHIGGPEIQDVNKLRRSN